MPLTAHDGQRRGSKDDGGGSGSGAGGAAGKAAPGKVTRTEQLAPRPQANDQTNAQAAKTPAPPHTAAAATAAAAAPTPVGSARPPSIHDGAAQDPLFRDGFVSTFVTPPPATPAAPAPALKVKSMTLRELHHHTQQHRDWDSGALDADKAAVRRVLDCALAEQHLVLDSCGAMSVHSMLALRLGEDAAAAAQLAAYSRALSASRKAAGIRIHRAEIAPKNACNLGAAILKLEKQLPLAMLERIVPQTDSLPCLEQLIIAGAVDDFIHYVLTCAPLLDTRNGKDMKSFLQFHEDSFDDLASFRAHLPHIRNYHHFSRQQLDLLAAKSALAKANPSGAKLPVCVVLQCATDASGAFHHDDQLTAVLARPTHLTLLAEGKKSLDEFAAALTAFSAAGVAGKLDEILLSGHGGAKKIELAGYEAMGEVHAEKLTIDAADGPGERQASARLFAAIAQSLRPGANARVVLNACLTASHQVPNSAQLPKEPAAAAAKLHELVAADLNLATALQKQLGPDRQVIGANASFAPGTALLEPDTQRIGISSAADPALTGTKLQYLQQGIEPQGVLRAFIEVFGADPKSALAAAKQRRDALAAERAWRTRVIYALLHLACEHEHDAALHVQLANSAGPLSALCDIELCSIAGLIQAGVPVAHREKIFTLLAATTDWAEKPALAAVMLQGWSATNPSKVSDLRKLLDGARRFTIGNRKYFETKLLEPVLPLFLSGAPAKPAPYSDLFIAMLFLVERRAAAPPLAKAYVKAVAAAHAGTLPERLYGELLLGVDLAAVLADAATGTAATGKPAPAAGSGAGDKDRKVNR